MHVSKLIFKLNIHLFLIFWKVYEVQKKINTLVLSMT
jgi:hypothetical protein